ncbi:hypothetical protein HNR36_001382 [Ureibacillus thermosphaericus]|uniref:Uncharacterized protein n=1 Tax=Ureibacillus thermosphaericus TaxID=51173 RepID=A0A840Q1R8_URETH|nr:hypothetical protein [Ureibacillus thermosphaericus]
MPKTGVYKDHYLLAVALVAVVATYKNWKKGRL